MSYKIKKLQLDKAKELGVQILPSDNPNKKVDVFIEGKKIVSIGANKSKIKGKPMMDYASYLKSDPTKAEQRRKNYIERHSKEPKIDKKTGRPSKSFYSDEILWGKKKDTINKGVIKNLNKLKKEVKEKIARKKLAEKDLTPAMKRALKPKKKPKK